MASTSYLSAFRQNPSITCRCAHKISYKSRKTGRTGHYGVLPRQEWRFDVAVKRNFQRSMGKKYGYEMGLEDRILVTSLGQRQRHLDQKKMKQLATILEGKLGDVVSSNEEVASLAPEFTKVTVNSSFTDVRIWWMCNGVDDEKTKDCLDRNRHSLRKALSDSVGVTCPELNFVPDRTNLIQQEMDRLFRIADYGTDYRALSQTGRILGGVSEPKQQATKKPVQSEDDK